MAVSKTKPVPQLMECYDAGHRDFGENYVQEIVEKAAVMPADVRWRFIGHVQSNKAKALVKGVPGLVAVESVDSVKLANKLDAAVRESAEARMKAFSTTTNPPLGVMVQVNTSGEESKFGVEPESALALAEHILQSCGSLRLEGLMTIGMKDYTSKPENRRAQEVPRRRARGSGGFRPQLRVKTRALHGHVRRLRGSHRDGKRQRARGLIHLRGEGIHVLGGAGEVIF